MAERTLPITYTTSNLLDYFPEIRTRIPGLDYIGAVFSLDEKGLVLEDVYCWDATGRALPEGQDLLDSEVESIRLFLMEELHIFSSANFKEHKA